MKQDWENKPLGAICDILDNIRKPITKRNRIEGNIPYYGATGVLSYVKDFLFDEPLILLGEDGAKWESGANSAFKITGKTWVNNHAHVLRPHRTVLADNWLIYNLNHQDLMPYVSGMTVPKLNQGNMRIISVPVPPLPEQKRIVAKLDQAFEAINNAKANVERNLQNAKDLYQSQLNEIFSQTGEDWVEQRLDEVCAVLNGYAFKSVDTVEYSNTQLLRMGNLYKNKLNLQRKPVFYPENFSIDYKEYILNPEDLVMSLTGTVGKRDYGFTVEIPQTPLNLLLNQRIMKISIKDTSILDKALLHYFLLSPRFLDELYSTANGTRQANLSSKTILTLKISFPEDIVEQQAIVNRLTTIKNYSQSLESTYQQELDALGEIKKSILQKAFNGEL